MWSKFHHTEEDTELMEGKNVSYDPPISHFFYKYNMTLLIEVYTVWTAFVYNITKFTCQIHIYFHYFVLLVYSHCINNWSHYDIFIHGYNILWSNSLPYYPLLNLLLPHPRWSSFLSQVVLPLFLFPFFFIIKEISISWGLPKKSQ